MPSVTFAEVAAYLARYHNKRKGKKDTGETLNRLFDKHVKKHQPDIPQNVPRLSASNTDVLLEQWPTTRLIDVLPRGARTDDEPRAVTDDPVVVVRFHSRDCLIDGRRRINRWKRIGDSQVHPVWILRVLRDSVDVSTQGGES